jgi:hypothetical protein
VRWNWRLTKHRHTSFETWDLPQMAHLVCWAVPFRPFMSPSEYWVAEQGLQQQILGRQPTYQLGSNSATQLHQAGCVYKMNYSRAPKWLFSSKLRWGKQKLRKQKDCLGIPGSSPLSSEAEWASPAAAEQPGMQLQGLGLLCVSKGFRLAVESKELDLNDRLFK